MAKSRRQVSIFINGKAIGNDLKSIRTEARKVASELNQMEIGSKEYNERVKDLRKLRGVMREHRDNLRGIDKSIKKTSSGMEQFIGIAAGAFAVDRIVQYGAELFKLGAEMEVLTAKAETVFAEALPQVTQAAEANAAAMGFTISQYTDAAAAIGDLLVPMGFTRDEAANVSIELTNLSGALAEWTGGQVSATEVTDILGKAILGERESLKQLGISIKESDVTARLAAKGLQNLTGASLEQAKAAATLELITEKSVDAQESFAEGADTNIRKLAELRARIETVRERLANALVPIFSSLLDGAIELSDAIEDLGINLGSATDKFDKQEASVQALEGELLPLLERYEELTNQSSLTEKEQEELGNVIQRVGELTPTAITEIDEYGRVLSVNTDASREFLKAEKARLAFVNKEAISSLETQIKRLKEQRDIQKEVVETGRGGLLNVEYSPGVINKAREDVARLAKDIDGAQAQLNRLTGNDINEPQIPTTPEDDGNGNGDGGNGDGGNGDGDGDGDKTIANLQKQYQKILEVTRNFAEKQRLARLDEQEKAEAQILAKYQEQIDKARELEAKGIQEAGEARKELEMLQQQELETLRDDFLVKDLEAQNERFDKELEQMNQQMQQQIDNEVEFLLAKEEAKQEVEAVLKEGQMSQQEQELEELRLYFEQLTEMAEEYGINVAGITEEYNRRRSEINDQYRDEELQKNQQAQQEQLQSVAQGFGSLASAVGNFQQTAEAFGAKSAQAQKTFALIQIAARTGEAIATGVAKAIAAGPFPANLAAIASTVGVVLSQMAAAKAALSDAPNVTQRKDGGYVNVKGAQDGVKYRAKYLGEQDSGMLPGSPVVLASERGAEYFVANHDLRDPLVLDHVQAIDNIVNHRLGGIPQYADGGATAELPNRSNAVGSARRSLGAGSGGSMANDQAQLILLKEISDKLDNIRAVIDDDTVVGIQDRFRKLNRLSGGAL